MSVVRIIHSVLFFYRKLNNSEQTRQLSLVGDLNADDGEAQMAAMQIDDFSGMVLKLEVDKAERLMATV